MHTRSLSLLTASLALGAVLFGLVVWWVYIQAGQTEIVFLDIGQGDAILISQGSNQVLVDGGRTGRNLLAHLGRHVPFWDKRIEAVIATHPDSDHIGGLPALFGAYEVGTFLSTGATSDTDTSRLLQEAAGQATQGKRVIFRGGSIDFPEGGKLSVEYPFHALSGNQLDTNEGSIVARFSYGKTSFLLTGDLPHEETALPNEGPATVLKAAHHGSRFSTSAQFLDLVRPQDAIISVGKNNYGHPSEEVMSRLAERGVTIRRTDQGGDLRYSCSFREDSCRFIGR